MVSRGGRSRGCANCRKRRVKCDETVPACKRCEKRGLKCDGPKEQTWIVHSSNSSDMSVSAGPAWVQDNFNPTAFLCNPPTGLSLKAFEDDIAVAYTRKVLLRGGPVELACNMTCLNGLDLKIDPGMRLLRDAILSLAVTFFGNQHHQITIQNRGYQQYGMVLRNLNEHLAITELQTTDETILTALTCMMLEIFLPTAPNNFLRHMQGIEAILALRGPPPLPMATTTKIIFQGLRVMSIAGGLAMSRTCIYSRDEWKEIPCMYMDPAGRLRHRIFCILADCTRFMSERDLVLATGNPSDRMSTLEETKSALINLEAIYEEWVEFDKKEREDSPSKEMLKDALVANQVSATVFMLYHSTYICLLEVIDALEPSPSYKSLKINAAHKIIHSLERKMFQKANGAPESNTIGFVATKVAWQALGGFSSPEGRKLARAVKNTVNGIFAIGAWGPMIKHTPAPKADAPVKILWNIWWKGQMNEFEEAGVDAGLNPVTPMIFPRQTPNAPEAAFDNFLTAKIDGTNDFHQKSIEQFVHNSHENIDIPIF